MQHLKVEGRLEIVFPISVNYKYFLRGISKVFQNTGAN